MRIVLVSQRLSDVEAYSETREALDIRWAELLGEVDLLPVPTAIHVDAADYFEQLDIAGLILTGGNNLGLLQQSRISRLRDDAERGLLGEAMRRGVPVLGVCRGMQFIATELGGSIEAVEGHVGSRHELATTGEGPIRDALSDSRLVNSYHDFGITSLPSELAAAAHSQDGVIEAFAHVRHPMFGIMWHPEREKPFDSRDIHFLKALFS